MRPVGPGSLVTRHKKDDGPQCPWPRVLQVGSVTETRPSSGGDAMVPSLTTELSHMSLEKSHPALSQGQSLEMYQSLALLMLCRNF